VSKRIVITGMGAVTPVGIGVSNYWKGLIEGKGGVGPITKFDASDLTVQIAAEVPGFHPEEFMSKKLVNHTDPFTQFALAAAKEALEDITIDNPERTGIVMGSAVGGITTITQAQDNLTKTGNHRISPHFMPSILGNVTASRVAIEYGLKGPSLTVSTACSSGADAIGIASEKLMLGEADIMIGLGAECILRPLVIDGLSSARALSRNNDHPELASRPFDKDRDGFVIGEGAGVVVLETLEHAQQRGATIFGELIGYANIGSGYHITSPEPDGSSEIRCMQKALKMADLDPSDIDYINAHGTSTPVGDPIETHAVKSVFGDYSKNIPISSTKGATGHLMGAGGITEMIACLKAIEEGIVPPTINLKNNDPKCDLDYVPQEARKVDVNIAMSNSFGFGGQNASLIVKHFE